MTLKQLSQISGVSITHINDIENNIHTPTVVILDRIAQALEVDICKLYKREDHDLVIHTK